MRRMIARTLAVLALGAALAAPAPAASLKVGPARFIIHDVEPGRLYDVQAETGLALTVYNDGDSEQAWVLSVHQPSDRGDWEKGYGEIPDPSWCWFENTEITVAPKSKTEARFFLHIPEDPRHYNQHWVVTFAIGGKTGGAGLGLAANIRAQIETAVKTDPASPPAGNTGLAPARITFEDAAPGTVAEQRVRLHNGTDKAVKYTLAPLLDQVKDPSAYLTGGYRRLPERSWLKYPASLPVAAGETAVFPVTLDVPGAPENAGKQWEEMIMVQPAEGPPAFLRVRVTTKETG